MLLISTTFLPCSMLSTLVILTLYVNATSLDYIQVRKFEHDKEDVIENYERYESLVSYMLSDTLLELRIINTVLMKPKMDMFTLKLK